MPPWVVLNLEEKKAVVAEVAAEVAAAQTVVVAEYRGITVENMTQLRAQARKEGVYLRVLKNTWCVARLRIRRLQALPTSWSARLPTAFPRIRCLPPR
jgi:hypothetical protein